MGSNPYSDRFLDRWMLVIFAASWIVLLYAWYITNTGEILLVGLGCATISAILIDRYLRAQNR